MPPDIFIGTDIVEVSRIRKMVDSHQQRFIKRTYSANEQKYCKGKADPAIHFAGRFAAKEAIKKALMTAGIHDAISWLDMEIIADQNGAPIALLHGNSFDGIDCKISISHTRDTAIASALIIK